MNVAILGFKSQGSSNLAYYQALGHRVTICDQDADLETPDGVSARLGPSYLKGLDEFDIIVRTPSIYPARIAEANPDSPNILDKVTTNTNEFLRVCPTKNVIGVTGTKGKGTTSTLITRMLESIGHRVHLCGNIGTPPLDMLSGIQADDWVVMELANFQLIDVKYSPHIAACLMIVPEHLDWHGNMEDYITAKQQLFRWQNPEDISIYYADNEVSRQIASVGDGQKLPYYESPGAIVQDGNIVIDKTVICTLKDIALIGEHNWQNVCAAVTAVWQVSHDVSAIRKAIISFKGLPFRIELRRELDGVKFYNDSFAVNPGATTAAIHAIKRPKILILGGYERGLNLEHFAKLIKEKEDEIRAVVIIGASAVRVSEALRDQGFDRFTIDDRKDLSLIVSNAYSQAQSGDAVLFSPAFASFDMFDNFEARGRAFNAAVEALS